MNPFGRISSNFNSPSHRKDIDYTKLITHEAKRGVLLLLSQTPGPIDQSEWFNKVGNNSVLLHRFLIGLSAAFMCFFHRKRNSGQYPKDLVKPDKWTCRPNPSLTCAVEKGRKHVFCTALGA